MSQKRIHAQEKDGLHPRNLHRSRYDFPALISSHPALEAFVFVNEWGDTSINYADPAAVKALNAALLAHFYGIEKWDLPAGYLCPPIPGRADYIHNLADLLAVSNDGQIPEGRTVRVLDVGVGANAIYPMLGHRLYGWSFVGTEIDDVAARNAQEIFASNAVLTGGLEVRRQEHPDDILAGAVFSDERFDLTLCNPPFHASAEEAAAGSRRKLRNIGQRVTKQPLLNFSGLSHELWCEGGELAFVRKMIRQSRALADHCLWFTSLISRSEHLPPLYDEIERSGARNMRTLEMAQGQKLSRALAWSFFTTAEQQDWARAREQGCNES